MLKFENVANVGDVIKAFDFEPMEGRNDMYIIGRVIEKGPMYADMDGRQIYVCDGYKVFVKESHSGSENYDIDRMGTEMMVPFEMSMLDFDERVILL